MNKTRTDMYLSDDGVIKFKGEIHYTEEETKEVIIDGEKYINEKSISKVSTVDELRLDEWKNAHFYKISYILPGFGKIAEVEENNVFYRSLTDMSKPPKYCSGSENDYVNTLLVAHAYGLVNPVVKRVYTGSDKYGNMQDVWKEIMRSMEVEICIDCYGWNNALYATVDLMDFMKFNHEETDTFLIDLFKNNGVNLKSKNELHKTQKLITNKINYETSKQ
jgi:hypothetical protein